MADYIERQAALRAVNEFFHDPKVDIALNAVPDANVREDVHGEWIKERTFNGLHYVKCNKCGYKEHDHVKYTRFNFCPNCGARMTGGGEQ